MTAQHSSASPLWGTSRPLVDLSRVVLGRIDLDPFSDPTWNVIVGAKRILTERDDAFRCRWFEGAPMASHILKAPDGCGSDNARPHTSHVNGPGDLSGRVIKDAWRLTEWHHRTGWLGGGVIWIAFNIGQLQTLQADAPRSLLHPDFLRCIPSSRVAYEESPSARAERLAQLTTVQREIADAKGKRLARLRKRAAALSRCASPPHASAVVLLPAHGAAGDVQREVFRVVAGRLGECF